MDAALRLRLLGRRVADKPAILDGYRRVQVRGAVYPTLIPAPVDAVAGVVVAGLGGQDHRRLVRYEGPEYRVVERLVRGAAGESRKARLFLTPPGLASKIDWQEPA